MTLSGNYNRALSVTGEKPDIVEVDSDDEFTAEKFAEIEHIRKKAKKRKATAAPATPAKRVKQQDTEPHTADKVHNMMVKGVIAGEGLHPLLPRFDRTNDFLRDINHLSSHLSTSFLHIHSHLPCSSVVCISEDRRWVSKYIAASFPV